MVVLVGGIVALVIGVIGLIIWFDLFIKALLAIIPPIFILGGLLAIYLGREEMKDAANLAMSEEGPVSAPVESAPDAPSEDEA